MKRLVLLFAAFMLVFPAVAWASVEGMMKWSEISYVSEGIGNSGPVKISGLQTKAGISSLRIVAFDKTVDLSSAQLAQLGGFNANGLQLSFEAGYQETGGRTLYLLLTKGFTSGVQSTRRITFNEQGALSIQQ